MKKYLIWSLTSVALANVISACDEKGEPYIASGSDNNVAMTATLADSVWNKYMNSTFIDAEEVTPSDESEPYYKDFYNNWIDYRTEETRDVVITFHDDTVKVMWEDDSKKTKKFVKITAQGAHVTIHNDSLIDGAEGGRGRMNYILRGTTEDGSLRIYSNKKFMLTLDDVHITNPRGAAINIQKSFVKKRAFICLADDTDNSLADAEVYTDTIEGEKDKACLYSAGKLIFFGEKKGTGKLSVQSRNRHAIASSSRIHIHPGVNINVTGAVKDGLHADEIVMRGGLVKVFANKDAVQCGDSLDNGLLLMGGRLLSCGKRALTVPAFENAVFNYEAGEFCQVGNETTAPSAGLTTWTKVEEKGYSIVYSE